LSAFDPPRVIDVLARHKVEFVVIGGFAAELYQVPIPPTHDIDITPRMTEPTSLGCRARCEELRARVRTEGSPRGCPSLTTPPHWPAPPSVEELRERMGHARQERSTEPGASDRLAQP